MALVTTPGASTANSYASLAEANAYHATRLNADVWNGLDDAAKESALITAARVLDTMPQAWTGAAVDGVQALSWPRSGMLTRNGFAIDTVTIPQALKDAQSELARRLAETDRLGDNDVVNQGIASLTAGPVSLSFREKKSTDLTPVDAPTASVAGALFVPDFVKAMLVPSWLKLTVEQYHAVPKPMIFESME